MASQSPSRSFGGTGCPYCAGKRVIRGERPGQPLPGGSRQWHPMRNGCSGPNSGVAVQQPGRCGGGVKRATTTRRWRRPGPWMEAAAPTVQGGRRWQGFNDLATLAAGGWRPSGTGRSTAPNAGAGDGREPAEGMVGVPLWPRVEGGHLLPDGRAAQRLSRLRGQSPKPAGPRPSRLGGQSVKQRYRPHLNL